MNGYENSVDMSGASVSTAGDINGDGYADLLVGAPGHPNGVRKGRSYVVFGSPSVGSSGSILLSSLNGVNGFKLDGENNHDGSGFPARTAGDVNGDGYVDLLIGASGYTKGTCKGRSYVVFGGPGVGSSGNILLSSLNGVNGFKLDGENNYDYSGYSVSAAGDINGDEIADLLIGAYGYPNLTCKGRSYVVFGDAPPVLINNTLNLSTGETLPLTSKYLAAYDRNHDNATLVFIPGNISHGYFSTLSAPTIPLINFTQSQVSNGAIQFVHDGLAFAPSYDITVRSPGIAWTGPVPANISFVPTIPTILKKDNAPAILVVILGPLVVLAFLVGVWKRKKKQTVADIVKKGTSSFSKPHMDIPIQAKINSSLLTQPLFSGSENKLLPNEPEKLPQFPSQKEENVIPVLFAAVSPDSADERVLGVDEQKHCMIHLSGESVDANAPIFPDQDGDGAPTEKEKIMRRHRLF